MINKDRTHTLQKLIRLDGDVEALNNELKLFSWDANEPLVVLTINDLKNVLTKYLGGYITMDELERWANLIECREDIDYDNSFEDKLKAIINKLANPEINGRSNIDTIKCWIRE